MRTRDHRLFAALNVATGEVLTGCRTRHPGADVLRLFKLTRGVVL